MQHGGELVAGAADLDRGIAEASVLESDDNLEVIERLAPLPAIECPTLRLTANIVASSYAFTLSTLWMVREQERLREKWCRPVSAQHEPVKPARTRTKSKQSRPLRGASRPAK